MEAEDPGSIPLETLAINDFFFEAFSAFFVNVWSYYIIVD